MLVSEGEEKILMPCETCFHARHDCNAQRHHAQKVMCCYIITCNGTGDTALGANAKEDSISCLLLRSILCTIISRCLRQLINGESFTQPVRRPISVISMISVVSVTNVVTLHHSFHFSLTNRRQRLVQRCYQSRPYHLSRSCQCSYPHRCLPLAGSCIERWCGPL